MNALRVLICACVLLASGGISTFPQAAGGPAAADRPEAGYSRGAEGSLVPEPEDLRSRNGVLEAELAFRNYKDAHGQMRYCYVAEDGSQAPNLRLQPGDTLILRLKNEASGPQGAGHPSMGGSASPAGAKATKDAHGQGGRDACA